MKILYKKVLELINTYPNDAELGKNVRYLDLSESESISFVVNSTPNDMELGYLIRLMKY